MSKTELIDKRMLIDALNRVAMFHHETHIPMVEHDFRELINNMPTVNAVPVVRCKDCKHYSHDVDANEGEWDCCRVYGMFVNPNDFCSEGERKDGTK